MAGSILVSQEAYLVLRELNLEEIAVLVSMGHRLNEFCCEPLERERLMGEANQKGEKAEEGRQFSKEQYERHDLNIEYRITNNEHRSGARWLGRQGDS